MRNTTLILAMIALVGCAGDPEDACSDAAQAANMIQGEIGLGPATADQCARYEPALRNYYALCFPDQSASTTQRRVEGSLELAECDMSPVCVPACGEHICGSDGCGGTCGTCNPGDFCSVDQMSCGCDLDCSGRVCGDDGCGGSCGQCDNGDVCSTDGSACECVPDCSGTICGDDGCGGSCANCTGSFQGMVTITGNVAVYTSGGPFTCTTTITATVTASSSATSVSLNTGTCQFSASGSNQVVLVSFGSVVMLGGDSQFSGATDLHAQWPGLSGNAFDIAFIGGEFTAANAFEGSFSSPASASTSNLSISNVRATFSLTR